MNPILFAGEPITTATLHTMFEEQTEVFGNSDFWSHIADPDYPGKSGFHCLNALVDQTHYKESVNVSKLFFDFDNNASTSTPGASSSNSRPRSTRNKRATRPQPYTHSRLPSQESGFIPMSGSASAQPSYIPGVSHPQGPPPSSTYGFTPGMSPIYSFITNISHLLRSGPPPNSNYGSEQQFYMPSGGHSQGPPPSSTYGFAPGTSHSIL